MPKVLAIEDDELMAQEVLRALPAPGYTVQVARTGRDGIAKAIGGGYDIVTLDRKLPDLDGLTIVTTMRGVGIDTPVLIVSSMSHVDDRVRGLRAGGDDYLTKPFSHDEMRARVDALLRRKAGPASGDTVLRVHGLELNLVRRRATLHGRVLDLQPTEFRVLEFMMRHVGQVLTRTMIFEGVWGCRFDPGTNLIDVHVGRLRKKVDDTSGRPAIRTIRGSGYLLD
ncbi:MAG: two-component system, OmpR family, response regulator [Caballeronia sp.]|jgi:two-component system OmpR family response regulator|nr:two-component system, OmpR family, response regulator [Caballeronia sp.]